MTTATAAELSRRLDKFEARKSQADDDKIFIIDNIGRNGPIEYSKELLEDLKNQAIAKDPDRGIYIIDIPDAEGL